MGLLVKFCGHLRKSIVSSSIAGGLLIGLEGFLVSTVKTLYMWTIMSIIKGKRDLFQFFNPGFDVYDIKQLLVCRKSAYVIILLTTAHGCASFYTIPLEGGVSYSKDDLQKRFWEGKIFSFLFATSISIKKTSSQPATVSKQYRKMWFLAAWNCKKGWFRKLLCTELMTVKMLYCKKIVNFIQKITYLNKFVFESYLKLQYLTLRTKHPEGQNLPVADVSLFSSQISSSYSYHSTVSSPSLLIYCYRIILASTGDFSKIFPVQLLIDIILRFLRHCKIGL